MNARGEDRRQSPRREAERWQHYAEQSLIAAALAWADGGFHNAASDVALTQAVEVYRFAEAAAALEVET